MATKQPKVDLPTRQKRIRKIFGDIHEVIEMPNLIEVQRESYEQFLRSDPSIDYVSGLEKTLRSVFPIWDFAQTARLGIEGYELEDPKYDVEECRQRGITYAAPMKVRLSLQTFEVDPDTEAKSLIDIKEQDVYMGDMPRRFYAFPCPLRGAVQVRLLTLRSLRSAELSAYLAASMPAKGADTTICNR